MLRLPIDKEHRDGRRAMADDPKDMCKHCGHTRESHKMTAKNRENVKMLRKNGGGSKDRYEYSFRNCPRFNPEDKT